MTFNGPDDAARIAIESEQECRKLEKLLADHVERRDRAKAYLSAWFERPQPSSSELMPIGDPQRADLANGVYSGEAAQ